MDRPRRIMMLSLPIIGGMISQNVLNLVDTAMVGTLGDSALAAVGIASFAAFMANSFITGLSSGVQAMSARRLGEERVRETAVPLNGGLLLALAMALPLSAILFTLAPDLFPFLVEDQDVQAVGIPYLQVRMLGIAAVGVNFVFRGYWNGVNLSKVYMRTLIVMHVVNVALNYVLIFGAFGAPELGATGAAIGTTVSLYVGSAYYIVQGFMLARENGFVQGLPDKNTIVTMLRLSIPSSLQNLFFSAGMTTLFWIIGKVGTQELAASQVLINLFLLGLLPGMAFGIAGASLVGQALGRKDPDDAHRWAWDVVKLATVLVGALVSVPMALFPEVALGVFLHNEETLAIARPAMQLIALSLPADIMGVIFMNALVGAGDTRRVAVVSIVAQWAFALPLNYFFGVYMGFGMMGVWVMQTVYRTITSGVFMLLWQRGTWRDIKV
ncbi:MAG: MATE family efflux transporter [Myxococcota bacterium]